MYQLSPPMSRGSISFFFNKKNISSISEYKLCQRLQSNTNLHLNFIDITKIHSNTKIK